MRLLADRANAPALRHHGGASAAPHLREALLDLSANVNPYGPSAAMIAAVRAAPIRAYPDATARPVREALAAHLRREADEIVVGSGASELFWTFARALLSPRATVLLVAPAFAEVAAAVHAAGARVVTWTAEASRSFDVDADALARLAETVHADVVALTTPTSPAGRPVSPDAIAAIARAVPGACVLLDESFLALSDTHAAADVALPRNVVRVRSLTKDHAIAGLRVGYLLAEAQLAQIVEAARPPWTVSAPAEAAALAAIAEGPFVAQCRARLRADRAHLVFALEDRGYAPVPSVAPYVIVPVARGDRARARLLEAGVVVRDCASFGLPGYIRVAVRPRGETDRFTHALDAAGDLRC